MENLDFAVLEAGQQNLAAMLLTKAAAFMQYVQYAFNDSDYKRIDYYSRQAICEALRLDPVNSAGGRILLCTLWKSWRSCSGMPEYPVRKFATHPDVAFYMTEWRWKGEYGYERCKLWIYLLQRLQVVAGNGAYYGLED